MRIKYSDKQKGIKNSEYTIWKQFFHISF